MLLYRYAYVRLLSREEAEDTASQAFLNAFTAIDRFKYRNQSLLPWLYTITRNLVNQKRRKHQMVTIEGSRKEFIVEESTDNELVVERLDLLQAIDKLKQEQREVVLFRFGLDMSLRETAAMLGKSEAAVHSLQVRALQRLRTKL